MKKVLIAMDTSSISGPAKNLLYFLESQKNQKKVIFELVIFNYKDKENLFLQVLEKLPFTIWKIECAPGLTLDALKKFIDVLKQAKPDILQTHGYKTNFFALIAKISCSFLWVSFFHGWTTENWKVRFYHLLDYVSLRYADTIVTVSQTQAALIRKKISMKVVTIANAVDVHAIEATQPDLQVRVQMQIPADHKIILCLGRLSSEKGQEYLIEAFKKVSSEIEKVSLLLVGEGIDRAKLEALAKDNSRIHFFGFTRKPINILKAADLLVLPSLSEGMPNVVLEAFAAKVPVVASSVSDVPAMLDYGRCGKLVEPANIDQLTQAILQSLQEDQTEVIALAYKKVISEFSVEKRNESILELYAK